MSQIPSNITLIIILYTCNIIYIFFFFFNDTATTEIYTLSLHDALPISRRASDADRAGRDLRPRAERHPLPRPGRGGRDRQRREIRLIGLDLHAGCQPRVPGNGGDAHRNLLRQFVDHWRRSPPAVRRNQGHWQRSPRRRDGFVARYFLGMEGDLHRLQRQVAEGADRRVQNRRFIRISTANGSERPLQKQRSLPLAVPY